MSARPRRGDALVRQLCRLEGGEREIDVAQVSELLARLADLVVRRPAWTFAQLGRWIDRARRRAQRRARS